MTSHYLLQLIVDEKVVHEVIDQLLTFKTPLKFNIESINAYHASQCLTSTSELVSGHVQRTKIEVQVEGDYREVIAHAKAPLSFSEIEYLALPITEVGIA